jgi:hypothetical protein
MRRGFLSRAKAAKLSPGGQKEAREYQYRSMKREIHISISLFQLAFILRYKSLRM